MSNHNYKYTVLALQRQTNTTVDWLTKFRIKLNVSIKVAIIIGPRSQNHKMKLNIQNQQLEWNNHVKYLGATFNYNLNYNFLYQIKFSK